jgi:hypothetical protein
MSETKTVDVYFLRHDDIILKTSIFLSQVTPDIFVRSDGSNHYAFACNRNFPYDPICYVGKADTLEDAVKKAEHRLKEKSNYEWNDYFVMKRILDVEPSQFMIAISKQ